MQELQIFLRRYNVLILVFFTLTLRIFYAILSYLKESYKSLNDDNLYKHICDVMLKDGLLVRDILKLGDASVVGPGIAWVNLPFLYLFGNDWLVPFITSAIISTLISVIIYKFANYIGDMRVGLFSLILSLFYIQFLKYVPTYGKDLWMTLISTTIIYLTLKYNIDYRLRNIYGVIITILFVLLLHIDERFLAFIPLWLASVFLENNILKFSKANTIKFLSFFFLFILLMIPWQIRNYEVYNKIVIISVRTTPITDKVFSDGSKSFAILDTSRGYISPEQIDSIRTGKLNKLPFKAVNENERLDAIRMGILPHRFSKIEQAVNSFIQLWEPFDFNVGYAWNGYFLDGKWSFRHNISVMLSYGLILILAFIGFFVVFKNNKFHFIYILSIIFYYTLIHMIFIPFTNDRYRLPIDPLIVIVGAIGLNYIIQKYFNLNSLKKFTKSPII